MANNKRFQLINMPRTYLDLSTTQSAQLLTDDLKHITDALNTLILGDETYYNQQIADLSNQVSGLTSSSTATAPGTIPLGTFTDFTDSRYWQYYPSYWFSVVPTSTDVTITSRNAVSKTTTSLGIMAGMIFRPNIIPDENDEMEIQVTMVPASILDTGAAAFVDCGFGLTRIGSATGALYQDVVHIGLNASRQSGHNLQSFSSNFNVLESPNITEYAFDLGTPTITSLVLKWSQSRGNPSNANTFHLVTLTNNINGAGFTSIPTGALPPVIRNRRSFLLPVLRYGLFGLGIGVQDGMSVKMQDFKVVKGIILNDTNIVL